MTTLDRQTLITLGVKSSGLSDRSAPRTLTCSVVSGNDAGQAVDLGHRLVIVGADRDSDLLLTDPAVSRHHFELRRAPDGVRVRDLDSRNGTFVHETRITDAIVSPGTTIRVGHTELRIFATQAPTVSPSARTGFGGLIGESQPMREAFAILELAAPTDATVLIQGESGTGKDLAARALHDHSLRPEQPLVIVDCSAISEHLIDSQLFGHVRGAFTGAVDTRSGAFVEADGGTLFLDEIGELPLTAQAKLLRALEDQTVQPVGRDHRVKVDVRVIAATHCDLAKMVAEGTFRFDLFHRLAVVHVLMPPLRDRPNDIVGLVQAFYRAKGADPGDLQCNNLRLLSSHSWPGNVRELSNVLERGWVMAGSSGRPLHALPLGLQHGHAPTARTPTVDRSLPFKEAKARWNEIFERDYLTGVFADCGNNITRAAEHSGLTRRHMRELLRKHGLLGPEA